MFVTGFGMAAGANIGVMPPEVVAKEDADDGKKEAEEKTTQINILFHSRIPTIRAGRFSGGAT
jgi:hypothetical protein